MIFRERRKVMIVERIANVWTIVSKKSLPKNNVVRFRKKAYLIVPGNCAYVSRKYITYYITTEGEQLSFDKIDLQQQGELVEDIFCKQLVRQLSSSLNTTPLSWATIGFVVLGLASGIPLGFVINILLGVGA